MIATSKASVKKMLLYTNAALSRGIGLNLMVVVPKSRILPIVAVDTAAAIKFNMENRPIPIPI